MTTLARPVPTPSTGHLEANLAVLAIGSPRTAALIRAAAPRTDIQFGIADDGGVTASLGHGPDARQLASRRRPRTEARRLADRVDAEGSGLMVVMGFGLGEHVAALAPRASRTRRNGAILVYEPDIPLLRAVLDHTDCAGWLAASNIFLLSDADPAALATALRGIEGFVALGVKYVEHPGSLARLGDTGPFRERMAAAIDSVKTALATTLANSHLTIRNLLMNVDRYATGPGIADLAGVASGRPAIVVSAGPSLRRNIDLLSRPGLRDRFVIIAAQTVLRPLLSRGIRPHFVTALDYDEISTRFYEGLTEDDARGVTLVAEAKANPAILDAFPGAIRCVENDVLNGLLGPLARTMGSVPPGATVAHLAYSLARHLACDPVILVGQDLGFTDGQYYAAGAAIHRVWSGELNPFNTLEMMEWQRIVRGRASLRRTSDIGGRPVYTDEQMATYLSQFEREFLADTSRGLRVIDATEGGVAKAHANPMPLAAALTAFDPGTDLVLPVTARTLPSGGQLAEISARVREVRAGAWQVSRNCRRAATKLAEMLEHHRDQPRVNRLIGEVEHIRDEVMRIQPAFGLTDRLNQVGVLNRVRQDRDIDLAPNLSAIERQRRQIERDFKNVSWLGDAADHLGGLLDDTVRALAGGPKTTRERQGAAAPSGEHGPGTHVGDDRVPCVVRALIPLDLDCGALGTPRRLDQPLHDGMNPLQVTLTRLAACKRLAGVVLLCEDEAAARRLVGTPPRGLSLQYDPVPAGTLSARARALRGSRAWAAECWRGGLGYATVFDEAADPALVAPAMQRLGLDAAVCLGPDWCLVDPGLIDRLIDRHLERPDAHRLVFTNAAPGLAPCVIERGLAHDLASRPDAGVFATLGATLGYVPVRPRADPIAKPWCVSPSPATRDAHRRFIADTPGGRALCAAVLGSLGESWPAATAEHMVAAAPPERHTAPRELILELCTGRRTSGPRGEWLRSTAEPVERPCIPWALAVRLVRQHAEGGGTLLTLFGAGDPLLHPELPRLVREAGSLGLATHVRTDLAGTAETVGALIDASPDVISVDLMAESAPTYRALMGADLFEHVRGNLARILRAQSRAGGLPAPWIVPRMTRCDAAYEEIEPFYDRWTLAAGAAVIDALPAPLPGQRIEPLPRPDPAARRQWGSRMLVLCNGAAPASERDLAGERTIADAGRDGLQPAWRRVIASRRQAAEALGPSHPDLWTGW
ncbi:MAG: DUF115 domain-containing protein [Phycisphaerales bacterium]|nr:DUF115 domain-containing protein [Phycisphaerales bacterium]